MFKRTRLIVVFILGLCAAYLFGLYSYPRNIWPSSVLINIKNSPIAAYLGLATFDRFGRLLSFPGKVQIECPIQTPDTGVLLVIGQSNAANLGEKKFSTQYPHQVVNYFDSKCFVAASPLLGSVGAEGEFITPLADALVKNGTYKNVVIISSGMSGTPISRWQKDGDLNEMLLNRIQELHDKYSVTDVIWHQGENDFFNETSAKVYFGSFNSLRSTLAAAGVTAPIFISISTKCGVEKEWHMENPVSTGQRMLIDNKTVFLGVNTDELLSDRDRMNDVCHLNESGILKTAMAYSEAITAFHASK